jgi:hypothetical protein
MQLLIHALRGVRCVIVDLVLMEFNGGTDFMGTLKGPDMTFGEVLSESLRLRADALQLIATKCIFFACGAAARRFKQYGVQYTLHHPQCAWGGSSSANGCSAWHQYEELILFALGGDSGDQVAARLRLADARLRAISPASAHGTGAETSTACRSAADEVRVILLLRLHHDRGRLTRRPTS